MIKTFSQLDIGNVFEFAGALYIKKSTRTARLVSANQWFYFGKNNQCRLVLDGRYTFTHYANKYAPRYEVFFCGEYLFCCSGSLGEVVDRTVSYEKHRMRNYA